MAFGRGGGKRQRPDGAIGAEQPISAAKQPDAASYSRPRPPRGSDQFGRRTDVTTWMTPFDCMTLGTEISATPLFSPITKTLPF